MNITPPKRAAAKDVSPSDPGWSSPDALAPLCAIPLHSLSQPIGRELQTELEIGRKLAIEMEQRETIINDPDLGDYLNGLEQNIVHNSGLGGCFVVKLVEDVEANAYSLPGGFLYVTSGLILIAQSEGELTAALAHETAHVTAHHFVRIEHERRLWGRLALAGGPAGYMVRKFIGPLLTRKLIRNSEFEADRLSLKYQSASGHDPTEFRELLQTAFQYDGKPPSFVERLFVTHPLVTTRIKRLESLEDSSPPAAGPCVVDTSNFHEIKERLSRLIFPSPASQSP